MKHLMIALLFAGAAHAQLPPGLDKWIEQTRVAWEVPGIAVTVVRDGKIVVTKGYGVRRLGSPERVDEDTMFDIASLSKSFSAAAIATLVDEGKMSWDDPVRRYLPQVEFVDSYRTANVTIRDLLAHRVGVEPGNFMTRFANYDREEVLRRIRYLKEREPFRGGMMVYSNIGYLAAGEASAIAAKMPWADLIRTRLLEPLGMRDSTAGVEHTEAPNHVSPHGMIDGVQQPIRNKKNLITHAAGGVNSTAKDMARWLLFSLGDGTWEGKRIISTAAMQEMQSPQMIIRTTPEMRAARNVHFFGAYGLGWQVMDHRGHKMVWHSGSADGMPVFMAMLPVEKIGVVVMTNSWEVGTLHGAIVGRILDEFLGTVPPTDPIPEALKARNKARSEAAARREELEKSRIRNTSPSRPLEQYAGTYTDALHGDMVVTHADGRLTLQFAGDEKADLEHWHHDVFRVRWHDRAYEWADTFAAFGLNPEAKPHRLDMRLFRDVIEAVRK